MARAGASNNKRSATRKGAGKQAQARAAGLRANEGRAQRAPEPAPLMDEGTGRDIAGVVLAVAAVVSFIAVVSPTSAPVASAIASFYHLGFGLGAYVLPFAILGLAASLFLRERSWLNLRVCAGVAVIFVAVVSVLSLLVPYTDLSTSAMFETENLVTSGGYVGAFVASTLQNALGKPISLVVLIGAVAAGLVIIGFSISSFVESAATRARELAERRRVDVNASPWGDEHACEPNAVPRPAAADVRAQGNLFDDAGMAETTFLGDRETTVLLRDDKADVDEDPFVDVSAQLEAERAATRLLPRRGRKDKRAKRANVDAQPEGSADASAQTTVLGGAAAKTTVLNEADALASAGEDAEERAPWEEPSAAAEGGPSAPPTVATSEGPRPIPAFLQGAASDAPAAADVREQDGAGATADGASARTDARRADEPTTDEDDERRLPPLSMLRHNPAAAQGGEVSEELEQTAASLQSTLQEFGLRSRVVGWIAGPTVTTFKVQPGEGERLSRITNLENDIALSLAAEAVRIFAPIPGTSLVGIEIPNAERQTVAFGDILPYVTGGPLEFAVGRDSEGQPMVADLAKMPHLLIAGTTGSGKSVVISSIVMSLLMRTFPEDVRLIMVDPKRVEFAPYDGLPHLYVPVVTEPKQAASALQWAVSEMERRLKVFERLGVRKIATFNEKQAAGAFEHYDNPPAKMPYLVIVIDELSDLMMVAGKDVEASIVRIAQLGRAAGIHMIVATQRPSSNVVTGLIKANITNRIGLLVATGIDSRVILDQTGAEKLIGQGDMLFSRVDWGKPKRIQGCYVSDDEIFSVVEFVKEHCEADYHEEILSAVSPAPMGGHGGSGGFYNEPTDDDPLLWDAARIVVESQLGSTSGLQRRLKVGYARAGRIMDMLEEKGVVGPPDGSKPREVLLDEEGLAALRSVEAQLADEDALGGW